MVKHGYSRTLFIALLVALAVGEVMTVGITVSAGVLGGLCVGSDCDQVLGLYFCNDFLGCVVIAFFAASVVLAWRRAADFDAKRQAAAGGHGAIVPASELGFTDPASLSLPVTIRLGMAWRSRQSRIVLIALVAIFTIVAACTTLAYAPEPGQWPAGLVFVAGDGGLIAMVLRLGLFLFFVLREQLAVADEGLLGRRFGIPQLVRWQEARLFARVDASTFELSSSTGIVRFSYLKDEESLKPTVPFPQYRARMSAIFALIAERTGLQLIDLYEPKAR